VGRNRNLLNPEGIHGVLSGTVGAGLDPCGTVQTKFTIKSGETVQIAFLLGCGANDEEAQSLLKRFDNLAAVDAAAEETVELWNRILTTIQVGTPNRAFDILVNRWLLYQVLSCRLWGRSAFYQAGGAFGFRDQLQDSMALVYSRPDLARQQLIDSASREFEEGDVQHWWHPPKGEGTRTRFSDDLLWLLFVTAHYVQVTEDRGILDEIIPYLHSTPLAPHEQERYELPQVSRETGTLYEHCLRVLERGFRVGDHGLPLMGCGDWNDGMNHVGALGRGESVWVGWFLLKLIEDFTPIFEWKKDTESLDRNKTMNVKSIQSRSRGLCLRPRMPTEQIRLSPLSLSDLSPKKTIW
jgi:cyclic beta-1,2-glucan synthetase